jgi:hypothetical protein
MRAIVDSRVRRLPFNNLHRLASSMQQQVMATKELKDLRGQYRAAYTAYMHCVQQLSEASQRGEWPAADVLNAEERALNNLNSFRNALLAALFKHSTGT